MINTTLLEEVLNDQLENFKRKDPGITRHVDFEKYIGIQDTPHWGKRKTA